MSLFIVNNKPRLAISKIAGKRCTGNEEGGVIKVLGSKGNVKMLDFRLFTEKIFNRLEVLIYM